MTHTDKIEVRIIKHQSKTIAKAIFVLHTVNNETDKCSKYKCYNLVIGNG